MSLKKYTKNRVIKSEIKYGFLLVLVALVVYIGYGKYTKTFSVSPKSTNKEEINIEKDYTKEIPEEVMNSEDIDIQRLIEMSKDYKKANKILSNLSLYPKELVDLASKKAEVIDFVADYVDYNPSENKSISIKNDYKKGSIPLFIQWDERWGYDKYGKDFIAINGCGPTSLAMVAVGLTGNTDINPKSVADFSRENGYLVDGVGSSWSLMTEGAKHFGVKGKEIPLSEDVIFNTLRKGQPIIASMGPGEFTTQGHYVVLIGVDDNNKIIVNDSDSKERSKKTWDVDVFMKETKNLWSFTSR